MIVPMKKVSIVVQEDDAVSALEALRSMGILHVEHAQAPKGKDISLLSEDIALLNQVVGILSGYLPKKKIAHEHRNAGDWKQHARHIVDSQKRIDQLKEYSVTLMAQIGQWRPWGDFDPKEIQLLRAKGVVVRFYEILSDELDKVPPQVALKRISARGKTLYCAAFSQGDVEMPFKEIELPKISLAQAQARLAEDSRAVQLIREDIARHTRYYRDFLNIKSKFFGDLEFCEALRGMGEEAGLVYLKGYCPGECEAGLLEAAGSNKWGILIEDPVNDDPVPTLIRTPRWVSVIKPLFGLLEILPGYHELDVSFMFLIFFSLFFGILIGDAGYGLVYLIAAMFFHRKFKNKIKDQAPFFLFYVLSSCAIIWGVLTGSYFGQEWCAKLGLKPLIPALNDPRTMQTVCFFIGALHLSIAHGWRAVLKSPSVAALADVGWICVLWSAFFFARLLILGEPLPAFVMWLLYSGMACVVLFSDPQKNILKGIGSGLGTLALSLMNNFTDVVSYVRLFAVGMAGLAIAETTNVMSSGLGRDNAVAVIAGMLIIFVGHALNIILGPMSVLVHGVRLNVLEFSGHAGLGWSGVSYRPLKKDH